MDLHRVLATFRFHHRRLEQFVDTDKAHQVFRNWLEKTRSAIGYSPDIYLPVVAR